MNSRSNSKRQLMHEPLEPRRVLATFSVTNLLDGSVNAPNDLPGSLRQALFDANNNIGSDEVVFDAPAGTITLTAGKLEITDSVEIVGPGAKQLAISGNNMFPVIEAIFTAPNDDSLVSIEGLTIRDGFGGNASGIYSNVPLTVLDSAVIGNSSGAIGGVRANRLTILDSSITSNSGSVTGGIDAFELHVERSLIVNNEATSNGVGGIKAGKVNFASGTGSGIIRDSTIGNNSGAVGGVSGNDLTVEASSILNNAGTHAGGIVATGRFEISRSAIAGNSAGIDGGGLHLSGSGVVFNTTISGNVSAMFGGGISQLGPGGNLLIANSTITQNLATDGQGAGLHLDGFRVALYSTIVADNYGQDLTSTSPFAVRSNGYNIIGSYLNANWEPTDQTGVVDPGLGSLADNGGPTMTHEVLPGSPASDAGDPTLIPGSILKTPGNFENYEVPFTDGRGAPYPRMYGGRTDIGAFEANTVAPDIDFNRDDAYGCADIDALMAEIASGANDPAFDLNGDESVDLQDRDLWLAFAADFNRLTGPYLLGDADLNGIVDGLDFIVWNDNKFTQNTAWCAGEFTGDGIVDGIDHIAWNENKFTSSRIAASSVATIGETKMNAAPDSSSTSICDYHSRHSGFTAMPQTWSREELPRCGMPGRYPYDEMETAVFDDMVD